MMTCFFIKNFNCFAYQDLMNIQCLFDFVKIHGRLYIPFLSKNKFILVGVFYFGEERPHTDEIDDFQIKSVSDFIVLHLL